jgi:hypothetical protein
MTRDMRSKVDIAINDLVDEFINLKNRNASESEIEIWRNTVKDRYGNNSGLFLEQVRQRITPIN